VRERYAYEWVLRLENRRPRKGIVGSNPTLSASSFRKCLMRRELVRTPVCSLKYSPTISECQHEPDTQILGGDVTPAARSGMIPS